MPLISTHHFDSGTSIGFWHRAGLLPKKELIEIRELIPSRPPAPPKDSAYLQSCLDTSQPLIQLDMTPGLQQLLTKLQSGNIELSVSNVAEYVVSNFTYQYPPQTREASNVISSLCSDCGGYHAVFVGLLRLMNIPAVMDFGARLPTCSPHVWAWWWHQQKAEWIMIDLNDMQNKEPISDRVSFSLGTGPVIPNFPRPVMFIQNFLSWDYNFKLHEKLFSWHPKLGIEFKVGAATGEHGAGNAKLFQTSRVK